MENTKEIKLLDRKFNTEFLKYHSKQEENIPYIFDIPDRKQYYHISPGELENFKIFKIFNSNWISLPIDLKSLKNRCLSLKYPDEEEGEAGHVLQD